MNVPTKPEHHRSHFPRWSNHLAGFIAAILIYGGAASLAVWAVRVGHEPWWLLLLAGAAGLAALHAVGDLIDFLRGRSLAIDSGAPITAICGSTRFMAAIEAAAKALTLDGHIVVRPECDLKAIGANYDEAALKPIKDALDELHRNKIALADRVLVVAPGGYVGDSTYAEIQYAHQLHKPIRFVDLAHLADEFPTNDSEWSRASDRRLIAEILGGAGDARI